MIYIIFAALAPVAVLFYYLYRKDDFQKEPVMELLKAFGLGVLSAFLSLCISIPLGILGFFPFEPTGVLGAPILAHGIYDTILFCAEVLPETLSLAMMVVFLIFCNSLRKHASKRIRLHLVNDEVVRLKELTTNI